MLSRAAPSKNTEQLVGTNPARVEGEVGPAFHCADGGERADRGVRLGGQAGGQVSAAVSLQLSPLSAAVSHTAAGARVLCSGGWCGEKRRFKFKHGRKNRRPTAR